MPAKDMAAYMRERRARKAAEAAHALASGSPLRPPRTSEDIRARRAAKLGRLYTEAEIGRPRSAQERRWDAEIDALDARGRHAKWNGDGYSDDGPILDQPLALVPPAPVIPKPPTPAPVFRLPSAPAPVVHKPPAAHNPRIKSGEPAFRSPVQPGGMLAIGGKAGKGRAIVGYDPNRAPLGAHAIEISVYMSRMADVKLALAEAEAARSEAVKRRATQLEAQEAAREAERKAKTDHFIDAGLNTLRLLFGAV